MGDKPRRLAWGSAKRARLTAPLAFLFVCSLLAIGTSPAWASNYDMRGEWSIELTGSNPSNPPLPGSDVIHSMNAGGEYSGAASFLSGMVTGPVTGTVAGNETSIKVVATTPLGVITFIAEKLAIDTTENKFSGMGTYYNSKNEAYETGEVICIRTKTYQEVLEREEREKREAEEREERANIRGEWELTLKFGGQTSKAIALIAHEANSKNEFSSSEVTFEGGVNGAFQGTLEGNKATVKLTSEKSMIAPAAEFTSNAMSVTPTADPTSIAGSGTVRVPELSFETAGELVATRIHTYVEIEEREVKEREAQEAQEAKEAQEAQEALEAAERVAKEEQETTARRAREEREAQERLASQSLSSKTPSSTPPPAAPTTVLAAAPLSKALTTTGLGSLPLPLENPNSFAIHGHLTLVTTGTTGASHSGKSVKAKRLTMGTASFAIAAHASAKIAVKLSRSGAAALSHHHTLRVTVIVVSESTAGPSTTKQYTVTLRLHRGKG